VPRWAVWKSPRFAWRASVNAPRSKPNISASSKVSGIAAQFTSTNGPLDRGPARCRARATRPLPLPVSPWIRTGGRRRTSDARAIRRAIRSRTAKMPGLSPTSSVKSVVTAPAILPLATRGGQASTTTTYHHRDFSDLSDWFY
jgi:hypothetical protein